MQGMTRTSLGPLATGTRLTLEEFEAWPDDRLDETLRYELLDGVVVVSSAPGDLHNLCQHRLAVLLDAACPADLAILPGSGLLGAGSGLVPDLMVRRVRDLDNRRAVPLLVVELLSPATRSRDRGTKRRLYAELGVPSYWLVDHREPSILVLERGAGGYVEVAELTGHDRVTVTRPFPVELTPLALTLP